MKQIYTLIFVLLICTSVESQYVQKVTSMNYFGANGLNPVNLTVFNGKLYFFGTNDVNFVDYLMVTPDGSAAGVTVVKQIDSMMQYPSLKHLNILNNLLIFDNHTQLWKSDGTAEGTSSVANLTISSENYAVLNNKVYFAGDNTNSNPIIDQLWQSDGTAAGTTLVKTINASGPANISNMYSYGGKIYFNANDGENQTQLWISDGTAAGTMMLKRLNPTGESSASYFIAYNGKVYFSASDGVNGVQLWATDGTTGGTVEITHINVTGVVGLYPGNFTLYNSKMYFMGADSSAFFQLWATDGTTAGTVKVKTDYTNNTYSGFQPASMAVHKNKLYMSGYDSLSKTTQLWVMDSIANTPSKVTSFAHGLDPSKLFSFQDKLIMTGYDTISNEEQLFATDGTAAGIVCPVPPGTAGESIFYPWQAWVPFNNAVYFTAAYTFWSDYQLCRYTEFPSGISHMAEETLAVYPNPSGGIFNVVLPKSITSAQIEVSDITGLPVYHKTAVNAITTVDLTNHPSGVYILKVTTNNQTITTKKIIRN
jgi:ELWxxDGT repeat protein